MASPNELSFLPDDYLERKAQRRTNAICAVLFLIVMVAIGSTFTITERAVREVEREHEQVEKEYTEAAKRIQLVQQLQDKQRRMAQQAELAASLLEKVPRSFLLAEITNALPAGVSLLDLNMESRLKVASQVTGSSAKQAFEQKKSSASAADAKKKAAESAAPAPKVFDVTLKISGVAYTDVQVAMFITKLNQSKFLQDVNLLISDQFKLNEEQVRKFQIEARLNPQAEVNPAAADANTQTTALEIKELQSR